MLKDWVGHQHGRRDGLIQRAPAGLKLAVAMAIIGSTVAAPGRGQPGLFFVGAAVLALVAVAARISPGFLVRRLLLLSPFVAGVILANALQPDFRARALVLTGRSALCLSTLIVLSSTTPFSQVLLVLRRAHVPALLITTLTLMHRYLFVLAEEEQRMRRARASRTLVATRRLHWRVLGTVVGHLFLRASERAERIYDAMCARGWQ